MSAALAGGAAAARPLEADYGQFSKSHRIAIMTIHRIAIITINRIAVITINVIAVITINIIELITEVRSVFKISNRKMSILIIMIIAIIIVIIIVIIVMITIIIMILIMTIIVLTYYNDMIMHHYGQFSKSHVCFCGLDPGNLKVETVRTNKQQ